MDRRIFVALTFVWTMVAVGLARGNEAAAVFPMSSVENVDVRNQLLTFKSNDGRLWLLRVADPAAMKRESLAKGDVVSIEVGLDDQIVGIVKAGPPTQSDRHGRRQK